MIVVRYECPTHGDIETDHCDACFVLYGESWVVKITEASEPTHPDDPQTLSTNETQTKLSPE